MESCNKSRMTCSLVRSAACLCLLAYFLVSLSSCAKKPDPDPEFRPLLLHWTGLSTEAEEAEIKDACVIRITSQLMQEPLVVASKVETLSYNAFYGLERGNLVFDGFEADSSQRDKPEYHWTATCEKGESGENVVVRFHNGQ